MRTLAFAAVCLATTLEFVRPDDYADAGAYGNYGGPGGMDAYSGDNYEYGREGPPPTPAFKKLDDVDSVDMFLKDQDTEPAVIGFFNPANQADITAFEETASVYQYDMRFAYSTSESVLKHYKATSGCLVNVYKPPRFIVDKLEKPKARFPGSSVDSKALAKFMKKNALPLVGQKTWKSNERYEAAGVPIVTLFVDVDLEKNAKGFDYYANRMRKVAAEFKGKLVFNVADKGDFSYLVEDYGLSLAEKKDLGVGIKDGNKHYALTETFSVESLRAFCEQFLAGSLTPKIKEAPTYTSEDEEADEDDGSASEVVDVTDANFNEVVMAPGKDVMVEFFAPWCGHCKQLAPTYKKLAAALKGVDSVTIAAMDATESDPPEGFDVQGYPTLIFVPGNTKTPTPYEGRRDFQSLLNFIKKNAATPIQENKDEL